ncbi:hypothetical protein H7347_07235 [Corynebacterium sp. zg-331]|uniref:phage tail tube protein n=1 Tax=unclassified Corynebacterium TaxID=2624378 RepID=UPI00128D42F7|nr:MULTISPECIES: hypothetical protein [unclassified Corynebacterium]MBC3186366.1 hypothetical protein [Corynebacterium sp. zg-331]MPV52853.1 hypothetical protein [Corynebacterium sp. zg331]
MAETQYYDDNAVFIPGRGAVLIAEAGTEPPELTAIQTWISSGAKGILGAYHPLGHTSEEELPNIEADVEGGEKKGSWENPSLRTTATKVTETITVTPIQWSEEPMQHRFGPGTVNKNGYFEVPDVYTATESAMLVIIMDGKGFLVFHLSKVASAPEGGIEFDPESFAGMPIKYTILTMTGKKKMSVGRLGAIPTKPTLGS